MAVLVLQRADGTLGCTKHSTRSGSEAAAVSHATHWRHPALQLPPASSQGACGQRGAPLWDSSAGTARGRVRAERVGVGVRFAPGIGFCVVLCGAGVWPR